MTSLENTLLGGIFGLSLLTSSCVAMAQPAPADLEASAAASKLCVTITENAVPDALARTPDTSRPFLVQDRRFPGRGYRQGQYPDYEVTKDILNKVFSDCMAASGFGI